MYTLDLFDMKNILSDTEMKYVERIVIFCSSRKEIAECFHRSFDTVASQLKNIYKKLDINSLSELCQLYYAEEFNIKDLIEAKKKELAASIMICLMLITLNFDNQEFLRLRRFRREVEIEIITVTVHGV